MEQLFLDLTIVLVIAAGLSFILHKLQLPTILAYIFTGLLVGPIYLELSDGMHLLETEEVFYALSKIGITLLLFILGLEMKVSELRSVGRVAVVTGIGQIVFTSLIGFLFAIILGFETTESLYIAIGLTFSSTIVIVKLLSDKKDLSSLYGKISIGFLLIQDFVAIAALVILNGISQSESGSFDPLLLGELILKAIILFGVVILLSNSVIPWLVHKVSGSLELLFTASLAWAFGIAWLIQSQYVGLSIEIGGFLAGLALANSVQSLQIVSKIRALRDFFIIVFFVHLGLTLEFTNLGDAIIPAIFFSIFVLIGNPIIVMALLGVLGYKSRTGFLAGLTVAQISEFSLIVIALGITRGDVTNEVASIMTIVAVITFAASSYMIMKSETLYTHLAPVLKLFEKRGGHVDTIEATGEMHDHVVLIGAHRMGDAVLHNFVSDPDKLLIVDFNPAIVQQLKKQGYNAVFGDITEHTIFEELSLEKARAVISTIPNFEDNMIVIARTRTIREDIDILVNAERPENKEALLNAGATMIIEPYKLAGEMLSNIVKHSELQVKK